MASLREASLAARVVGREVKRFAPHLATFSEWAEAEGIKHAKHNASAFGLHANHKGLVWFVMGFEGEAYYENEVVPLQQSLSWKTLERYAARLGTTVS